MVTKLCWNNYRITERNPADLCLSLKQLWLCSAIFIFKGIPWLSNGYNIGLSYSLHFHKERSSSSLRSRAPHWSDHPREKLLYRYNCYQEPNSIPHHAIACSHAINAYAACYRDGGDWRQKVSKKPFLLTSIKALKPTTGFLGQMWDFGRFFVQGQKTSEDKLCPSLPRAQFVSQ